MSYSNNKLQLKWVLASIVIMLITQGLLSLLFGIITFFTFGLGLVLFYVLKPVAYFVGGYITGRLSPGITIIEPAVGAVIITVIGILLDGSRTAGSVIWMIISGVIACAAAIYGASRGEKKQATGD